MDSYAIVEYWMYKIGNILDANVFAIIFGFSKNNLVCNKTLNSFANDLKVNKSTIYRSLNRLTKNGYIEKKEKQIGMIKKCEYYAVITKDFFESKDATDKKISCNPQITTKSKYIELDSQQIHKLILTYGAQNVNIVTQKIKDNYDEATYEDYDRECLNILYDKYGFDIVYRVMEVEKLNCFENIIDRCNELNSI